MTVQNIVRLYRSSACSASLSNGGAVDHVRRGRHLDGAQFFVKGQRTGVGRLGDPPDEDVALPLRLAHDRGHQPARHALAAQALLDDDVVRYRPRAALAVS